MFFYQLQSIDHVRNSIEFSKVVRHNFYINYLSCMFLFSLTLSTLFFKAFLRENGIEQSMRCAGVANHSSESSENGLSDAHRPQAAGLAEQNCSRIWYRTSRTPPCTPLRSVPPATVRRCRRVALDGGARGNQHERMNLFCSTAGTTSSIVTRRCSRIKTSAQALGAVDCRVCTRGPGRPSGPRVSPYSRGSGTGTNGPPDPR